MSRTSWVSDYSRPCSCGRRQCGDGRRLWHAVRVGAMQGALLFCIVVVLEVLFR